MPKVNLFKDENDLPEFYEAVTRINSFDYTHDTLHEFIKEHCIKNGEPLVVSNFDKSPGWKDTELTLEKLKEYRGDSEFDVYGKYPGVDKISSKVGSFIEHIEKVYKLAPNLNPSYPKLSYAAEKAYAKDIVSPEEFREAMANFLPEYLLPHGSNDLFSFLPDRFKAENLMCYLGQSKTGTPIHRDLCGTMGHNVMITTSPGAYAEWFIVDNSQRDALAEIIEPTIYENKKTNRLDRICRKQERTRTKSSFMESDRAWLTHYMIKKGKLKVKVIIQRKGDLVIVPSRAYHQVRNFGVSVKIAWNRVTPDTLMHAFIDQIPLYRIINRPEVYKCKAIVTFTIQHWNDEIKYVLNEVMNFKIGDPYPKLPALKNGVEAFIENSRITLDLLLREVIFPELLYGDMRHEIIEDEPGEVCTVICDFCHGDVFNRYYHCETCNQYDICMDCYVMGRGCQHIDKMQMHQSEQKLTDIIALYCDYIENTNKLFNSNLVVSPELEEKLKTPPDEASNLATTCRRIEMYRKLKKRGCNSLMCGHCSKKSSIEDLCQKGYSLASIFQRKLCPQIPIKDNADKILKQYVCEKCVNKCKGCEPIKIDTESMDNYDLVYYLHPAHDERNYGGHIDFNIPKTYDLFKPVKAAIPTPTTKRKRTVLADAQVLEKPVRKRTRTAKAEEAFQAKEIKREPKKRTGRKPTAVASGRVQKKSSSPKVSAKSVVKATPHQAAKNTTAKSVASRTVTPKTTTAKTTTAKTTTAKSVASRTVTPKTTTAKTTTAKTTTRIAKPRATTTNTKKTTNEQTRAVSSLEIAAPIETSKDVTIGLSVPLRITLLPPRRNPRRRSDDI